MRGLFKAGRGKYVAGRIEAQVNQTTTVAVNKNYLEIALSD